MNYQTHKKQEAWESFWWAEKKQKMNKSQQQAKKG